MLPQTAITGDLINFLKAIVASIVLKSSHANLPLFHAKSSHWSSRKLSHKWLLITRFVHFYVIKNNGEQMNNDFSQTYVYRADFLVVVSQELAWKVELMT